MFDHLTGRGVFVAECDIIRPAAENVDEDKKMVAVNLDLLYRT
jgi:hypothetical protein